MRPPLYLVVPPITLGLAGTALLTAAAPRTLAAVRVWGGPTRASGRASVRLECVRRAVGIDDHVALDGLAVKIGSTEVMTRCDEDGTSEVLVDLVGGGSVPLRITRGALVLADGVADVPTARWFSRATRQPSRIPGAGALKVDAWVSGGALPVGRETAIFLKPPEDLRSPAQLRLAMTGGDVGEITLTPRGLRVLLKPTFLAASLSVERASDPPGLGGWEARLPVAPSSLVVDDLRVEEREIRGTLRSTTRRTRAHVRLIDEETRRAAKTIALTPDGQGGAFGPFALPRGAEEGPLWLLVASDADTSTATSWPLEASTQFAEGRVVPDAAWFDGMVAIQALETHRVRRATRAVGFLVAAGALLEVVLLLARAQRSKVELGDHLAAMGDEGALIEQESTGSTLSIILAISSVLFGFAVIGVVLVWR